MLPQLTGMQILEKVRNSGISVAVLILSAKSQEKVRATMVFGKLKETEAVPYLKRMLQAESATVVIAASRAIAEIGEVSAVYLVLQALFKRTYVTFEGMSQILADYGEEICEPILDMLK